MTNTSCARSGAQVAVAGEPVTPGDDPGAVTAEQLVERADEIGPRPAPEGTRQSAPRPSSASIAPSIGFPTHTNETKRYARSERGAEGAPRAFGVVQRAAVDLLEAPLEIARVDRLQLLQRHRPPGLEQVRQERGAGVVGRPRRVVIPRLVVDQERERRNPRVVGGGPGIEKCLAQE